MEEQNQFRDKINIRNAELGENWWPFVENINEVLERMKEIEQIIVDVDNRVGESFGLARSITKSLYKLGLYDKEYKLNWKSVKLVEYLLEKTREEMEDERRRREDEKETDSESGAV